MRRSNEPVTISHLQLKCSIQLIEYMATVNYFVTANWYSLGSCCCSPINTTLPYKFLFLQWILFRWHIYIVSSINVCVNKYLCFFLLCLHYCTNSRGVSYKEDTSILSFLLVYQIFQFLSQYRELNLWFNVFFVSLQSSISTLWVI